MSKDYTIDFNAQPDVLLLKERQGVIRVLGRELKFGQAPEWCYSDPYSDYSFEACLIEESILYLKKTGEPNAKALKKAHTVLQTIISSFASYTHLYLVYDLTQLNYPDNSLIRAKLNKFTAYFSECCQNIYFLLPSSDLAATWLPSGERYTRISSLKEVVNDCIQQGTLIKEPGWKENFSMRDLEKLPREDMINTIKCLQEVNHELKQVHEQRMVEVLKMIETLAENYGPPPASQPIPAPDLSKLIYTLKQDISQFLPEDEKIHRELTANSSSLNNSKTADKFDGTEEQLRIISEHSQDLIYLLQSDGKIVYSSPSVYTLLGYTKKDIIGISYLDLIHPDDAVSSNKLTDFFLSEPTEKKWELRIRQKNGHYIWMEINTSVISDTYDGQNKILISSRNITEIVDVIDRLTESQEQLQSTFTSIDDDVYVFDKAHKLIANNIKPGKIGFLSICHAQCQGKSFREIFPKNLSEKLEIALNYIAETHEVQQFEHCLSDQQISFYFKVNVNCRQDSTGKYAGFTMVARDITEEKIADKKIIESEKKYRSVVESIREVIFQTDIHGKWSFLNPAWKEISGNDIYGSLEQAVVNFIHPDDKAGISQLFDDILQGKRDEAKCEVRFASSQNDIFWADLFVKVYLNDSGKIAGTSGTLNDITKRKKAEETLRQSKQLLESINKNIKEAILRINYSEGLVYFNQAFIEMFGYRSSEEVWQLPVNALFAEQEDLKIYTNTLREHKSLTNKTILFRRKDGSTFWGLTSFILINDEQGNEIYDGAIRDITDRKEAEKKLKEKNQELSKTNDELDRFVYSASHDLRAPLASTLGLINISRISKEEKERTYYLDLMEQSLNRMDKVIQDLTDYSRNARLEIETEEIDFERVIKDVLQRLKYLKTIDDVKIITKIEAKDRFYSDKIRLYVIMINLLSNSIKYHKYDQPNPFININITVNEKETLIEVTDNGIGIEKNHTDKIFTMFFQVSRDSIGSGLGLYIAKETINKLNGSITVKSVVNKGSTFTVTLPNAKTYNYETAG